MSQDKNSSLENTEKITVIVDNNSSLGYEKNKLSGILNLPLMLLLTFWVALKKKILGPNLKINTFWFDGISPACREIKENATKWRTLDIIYNYRFSKNKGFSGIITDFWLKIFNAQAVRNRLKLVKQKLREEIEIMSRKQSEVRLLSIASGSAQGVIEVMAEFKQKNISIKAIFLDLDSTAIEHGKKLSQKAEVINQITFINKGVNVLEEAVKDFKPHIVELVGFLEYRPRDRAIELIKRIYNILAENGVLLTSNINYNPERLFLYYVINWSMIYRSIQELAEILIKGGFDDKNCKIICEPLKIHKLAICQKII